MVTAEYLPKTCPIKKDLAYKKLTHPQYDLFLDGSIAKTVKLYDFTDQDIISVIDKCNPGTKIQIYRVGDRKTYLTVNTPVKCELKVRWRDIFLSKKKYYKKLLSYTQESIQTIDDILSSIFDKSDHKINPDELYSSFYTCRPLFNHSIIKTGKRRISTIKSVKNVGVHAIPYDIPIDDRFVTVMSLIKPDEALQKIISRKKSETQKLIIRLRGYEETYLPETQNDNWFINVSFLIHAASFEDLKARNNEITEKMYNQGITLYQHTNTIFKQYLSLFCGYASYGEQFKVGVSQLTKKVVLTFINF